MVPIIMLCGEAGSGKDTLANMLCDKFKTAKKIALAAPLKEFSSYVFEIHNDYLYGESSKRSEIIDNSKSPYFWERAEKKLTSWTTEIGLMNMGIKDGMPSLKRWFESFKNENKNSGFTTRKILQSFGDWARAYNPNMLIDFALKEAEKEIRQYNTNLIILNDGRRRNEILRAAMHGIKLIKIKTLSENDQNKDQHLSESELKIIPDFWFDKVVCNHKKSLDILEEHSSALYRMLIEND